MYEFEVRTLCLQKDQEWYLHVYDTTGQNITTQDLWHINQTTTDGHWKQDTVLTPGNVLTAVYYIYVLRPDSIQELRI